MPRSSPRSSVGLSRKQIKQDIITPIRTNTFLQYHFKHSLPRRPILLSQISRHSCCVPAILWMFSLRLPDDTVEQISVHRDYVLISISWDQKSLKHNIITVSIQPETRKVFVGTCPGTSLNSCTLVPERYPLKSENCRLFDYFYVLSLKPLI